MITRIFQILAACPAVVLLAVGGFFARRHFIDVLDGRHNPPAATAPPVDRPLALVGVVAPAELVPMSLAADVRALFGEPTPEWWLTEWSPPAELLQPALIGDAMTVLHPSRELAQP